MQHIHAASPELNEHQDHQAAKTRGPVQQIIQQWLARIAAGDSRNTATMDMAKALQRNRPAIYANLVELAEGAVPKDQSRKRPFGFRQVDNAFRHAFKNRGIVRFDHRPEARRKHPHCEHPNNGLYAVIIGSGLKTVYTLCCRCLEEIPRTDASGRKIRGPLAYDSLPAGTGIGALEVVADLRGTVCRYCDSTEGVELNHYAPWEYFPEDAFKYETGYLCKACHRRFHQTIKAVIERMIQEALKAHAHDSEKKAA
jgi:hypothetical protein